MFLYLENVKLINIPPNKLYIGALMEKLLLDTIRGNRVERPPVWLMRQAGRILPQYRALRSKLSGFKELVETPDLAAEVTLQPLDELDVDAAIIFSDILVIPEALGLPYEMIKGKGPHFPRVIEQKTDITELDPSKDRILNELDYVFKALEKVKSSLSDEKTLIGFCGAPWTLFAYMLQGEGSKTFSKARKFLIQEPLLSHALLSKIAEASIHYMKGQEAAGAEVLQLFDSWAGLLSPDLYQKYALPYVRKILDELEVPTIFFAKGAHYALDEIDKLPASAIGLDWTMQAEFARSNLSEDRVVQGNLDPAVLYGKPEDIADATEGMIRAFHSHHIVNLGHGVYPDTPLEGVKAFVQAVKSYSY